jgi:hypothetical protein
MSNRGLAESGRLFKLLALVGLGFVLFLNFSMLFDVESIEVDLIDDRMLFVLSIEYKLVFGSLFDGL